MGKDEVEPEITRYRAAENARSSIKLVAGECYSRNAALTRSANERAAALAARPEGKTACTSTDPICRSGKTRVRDPLSSS